MDPSSPNGTIIFDRDDHPSHDKVTLVERENGEVAVFLNDREGQIWDRLRFLSEYIEYRDNIDFEVKYSKALDKFFRTYFTESEWTLAALSIP